MFVGNENLPPSRSVNPLPGDMRATTCSLDVLVRVGEHSFFHFIALAKATELPCCIEFFDAALPLSL
jgi:hypothetical protein